MTRPETCNSCKFWSLKEDSRYNEVIFPYDPVTYKQEEDEEKNAIKWGAKLRYCVNPKILFYQRPEKDGAAICDGSQYYGCLITGEEFGCVLHRVVEEDD